MGSGISSLHNRRTNSPLVNICFTTKDFTAAIPSVSPRSNAGSTFCNNGSYKSKSSRKTFSTSFLISSKLRFPSHIQFTCCFIVTSKRQSFNFFECDNISAWQSAISSIFRLRISPFSLSVRSSCKCILKSYQTLGDADIS